jgi:16S rRNA (cytosine1402-N4)-methyltransferase
VHETVLLEGAVEAMNIAADARCIDGTYGRGGHSAVILGRLGEEGRLMAIDKDPSAIVDARERFGSDERFEIVQGSFADMSSFAAEQGWEGQVNAILLDLGVSSPQLDVAERGFSFSRSGALDMRMNPDQGQSAAEWLAGAEEKEIADVLYIYGEERHSRRIARAITRAREESPINNTLQLAEIVADALPRRERGKHPATRSFQGIRIFINRELEDLEKGLAAAVDLLAPGGRLVVISFHSLEDRIVKRFIKRESQGEVLPRRLPIPGEAAAGRLRAVGKPVRPGEAEVSANPRARSAIMRVAERLS